MTDLSPAAQAVHDAFWSHPNGKPLVQDCPDTDQLVAALRAAAEPFHWTWSAEMCHKHLSTIAAELEAQ
jgi:hypothetical protein